MEVVGSNLKVLEVARIKNCNFRLEFELTVLAFSALAYDMLHQDPEHKSVHEVKKLERK